MECVNDQPSKKLIRSKSGLRIVVANEDQRSPFVIGEPQWTPDKEATHCTKCSTKFGFTTRRHHCRRCGQIYCSSCCDEKLEIPRMCFIDPVRVCLNCAPAVLEENKFFECHLKTLTNGATFMLEKEESIIDRENETLQCKLSQDHRYLIFDGAKIAPLEIGNIRILRLHKDPHSGITCIDLEYTRHESNVPSILRLSTINEPQQQKIGASWLLALQQAFKMQACNYQQYD
ncbi:zinc finger FYVE domain-containing protein 21 isoform X2 [Nilaparvata lugens]|uniref:zinc finger FYVE domain-containing protein 21 isoform X2 n=1 Tax=Nilaparvata lugens TaxID=108931 RepID=UPI00193E9B0E|nr:zinc finger FYVE domain-containing protein 21 isoform X2 [Nilaparvata lugens]